MSHLVIVVQNLQIGGFQRIALDQCYALTNRGISVQLILLENISFREYNSFISLETDLIQKYRIDIKYSTGSRINQLRIFYLLLKNSVKPVVFLSHTLRATVLIRLAGLMTKKQFKIYTTIHQIPSLSDALQIKKRFLYSLFSHELFIFSAQAKRDWDTKVENSIFLRKLFFRKPIKILRNGVFLDRLPPTLMQNLESKSNEVRLVFVGRPTSWKGVEIILKIAENKLINNAQILFFFPYISENILKNIPENIKSRVSIEIGKSIRDYKPQHGDIHLYAANYGPKSTYTEAISINCLEMSAIGIPSLVTKGGLGTWPEFVNSPLIHEIDWSDLNDAAKKILDINKCSIVLNDIKRFRKLVDINNHVDELIKLI